MHILLDKNVLNRKWFWKNEDWLKIPLYSKAVKYLSEEILEKEELLFKDAAIDKLKYMMIDALSSSIKDSWAIEGIELDSICIRSSLIKYLGLNIPEWKRFAFERSVEEDIAVKATVEALNNNNNISIETILDIHKTLKPPKTDTIWGKFRKETEYVVNGFPQEIVYIAPPPDQVPKLMEECVKFWYQSREILPRPIGSALCHLYFVIIHPFEDGNGRLARLLSDKYLVDDEYHIFRPYSLSSIIKQNKRGYYLRLDKINNEDGLNKYLYFIMHMHLDAINKSIEKCKVINNLNCIFEKYKNISDEQKHIIRTMSYNSEIKWSWTDVVFDLEDDEKASDAWNDLVDNECIKDGKLILDNCIKLFDKRHV